MEVLGAAEATCDWLRTLEVFLLALSAAGEIAIAFVIYWEWEGSRVDRFLEDADKENEDRQTIFAKYCELQPDSLDQRPRNERFREKIHEDQALKKVCDKNIRLFSRVGSRLPLWPALRNQVLDWHVVVFMWEILSPYVRERRKDAGRTFAQQFLEYALASAERLLEVQGKRKGWGIVHPYLVARKG
jgi:hypothetical protein